MNMIYGSKVKYLCVLALETKVLYRYNYAKVLYSLKSGTSVDLPLARSPDRDVLKL